MPESSVVAELMAVIASRRDHPPAERSYVVKLLEGGDPKILGKIAEEAAEVSAAALEAGEEGKAHLVYEAADLLFHVFVLLGRHHVSWSEVEAELARRFGTSGVVEKESRASKS